MHTHANTSTHTHTHIFAKLEQLVQTLDGKNEFTVSASVTKCIEKYIAKSAKIRVILKAGLMFVVAMAELGGTKASP